MRPVETERDRRRPDMGTAASSGAARERFVFCDATRWEGLPLGVASGGGGQLLTREGELWLCVLFSAARYFELMRLDEFLWWFRFLERRFGDRGVKE